MKINLMAAFGLNLLIFGSLHLLFLYLPTGAFQLYLLLAIFIGLICTMVGICTSDNEKEMTPKDHEQIREI